MYIYSHTPHSKGAKALARELGIRRIKHNGSRFRGSPHKTVINWGGAVLPHEVALCTVINSTISVGTAQNKLDCLNMIHEFVHIPQYTTDKQTALNWIRIDGHKVVCRTLLRGSAGAGIVLATTLEELVDAPLYTQYKPKKHEYRVHVMNEEVIDVQKKALRRGSEGNNFQIRTHDNGYIYMRNAIRVPEDAKTYAIQAVDACGLDFGAVDIIWNERENKSYVLEINTAPGLEGTTVEKYAETIRRNYA